MIVSKEMLQKTPPMLRDLIQKQINVDGEFAKTGNTSHRDSETAITSKPVKIKKDFVKQNYTTILLFIFLIT